MMRPIVKAVDLICICVNFKRSSYLFSVDVQLLFILLFFEKTVTVSITAFLFSKIMTIVNGNS